MSSEETEDNVPVLPRDSDPGSSVSSLLQDEYEELLRSALVTPRLDTAGGQRSELRLLGALHSLDDQEHDTQRRLATGLSPEAEDGRHSSRSERSQRVDPSTQSCYDAAGRAASRASLNRSPTPSQRSRQTQRSPTPSQRSRQTQRSPTPSQRSRQTQRSPTPSQRSRQTARTPSPSQRSRQTQPSSSSALLTELFICEENISQMEKILDTWSLHLKSSVVEELRRWRLLFIEQHNQELRREREQVHVLQSEMDGLKHLLEAYQTSSQRKDQVIVNLTQALERQKEKVEMMRSLTHWRMKHSLVQEEAQALRRAEQHHQRVLKRKVFVGWLSLLRGDWKEQVEAACRTRAQEVCSRMAAQYEAKIAEHCAAVEAAQAEMSRLREDRERCEEAMKKAFMRGVCALNMEALSMFNSATDRPGGSLQQEDTEEADSAVIGQFSSHPESSAHFSPVHFDPAPRPPSQNAPEEPMDSRTEGPPSTTVMQHSSLPPGGSAGSHRQQSGRVLTAAQQKPSKTVTARITARPALAKTHHSDLAKTPRHDLNKTPHHDLAKKTTCNDLARTTRSHLHVMGVAPPMSSIMVERHHPVTQLTVGQATAAMFPRPSHSGGPSHNGGPSHHNGGPSHHSGGPSHHSGGPRGKPLPTRPSSSSHSCNKHSIKVVD